MNAPLTPATRTEIQARIDSLNFDNGNNAALSMQTLAEWARIGKVKIIPAGKIDGDLVLRVKAP